MLTTEVLKRDAEVYEGNTWPHIKRIKGNWKRATQNMHAEDDLYLSF